MKVLLLVDEGGDVVDVADAATGESLPHDIKPCGSYRADLHPAVRLDCTRQQLDARVQRALNACISGGARHALPMPHVKLEGRALRGCVHLLRGREKPRDTGWPLDMRYCTGLTLVELERKLPNHSYMSVEFIRSQEFQERVRGVEAALRAEAGTPPGLLMPGNSALSAMVGATSSAYPKDPLLRTYRPDFLNVWKPRLNGNDFIRIYYSTWDAVHDSTRSAFGHGAQDVHFYVLLCWHLPPEMADQLLQLVRMNPDGQSWKQLAERKEFSRALDVSQRAREDIIKRFLESTALQQKQTDKRYVHTAADVLVSGAAASVPGAPAETPASVAYYSGCAPTHLNRGGIISLTGSSPMEPAYWWHGAPTPEHPGGEPWQMPGSGNGWPVLGTELVWNKSTVSVLSAAGHKRANGYVKLIPV